MPEPVGTDVVAPQPRIDAVRVKEEPSAASFEKVLREVRGKPKVGGREAKAKTTPSRRPQKGAKTVKCAKTRPVKKSPATQSEVSVPATAAERTAEPRETDGVQVQPGDVTVAAQRDTATPPAAMPETVDPDQTIIAETTRNVQVHPDPDFETANRVVPIESSNAEGLIEVQTQPRRAQSEGAEIEQAEVLVAAADTSPQLETPPESDETEVTHKLAQARPAPVALRESQPAKLAAPTATTLRPDAVVAAEQEADSGLTTPGREQPQPHADEAADPLRTGVTRVAGDPIDARRLPTGTPAPGFTVASPGATMLSPDKPAPQFQSAPSAPPAPPSQREIEFASANHERVVTAIRTQLLPRGGTMQIRLDPPNLGTLEVAVTVRDGIMDVSFHTSSDEATRLLSHSLSHLKLALESQGVAVDRMHVQQAPRDQDAARQDADQRQSDQDQTFARQEQQRKELLRRMWRRLALGNDPLDLVA